MNRKRWLGISLGLIALIIAIAVLIQSLPRLLETVLVRELSRMGVAEFTWGDPHWGLSGAGATRVAFSGTYESWRYDVVLKDVEARYSLRALWRGDVDAVDFDAATVRVAQQTRDDGPVQPIDLHQLLRGLHTLELPVARFTLDTLELAYTAPAFSLDLRGGNIELNSRRQAATGQLTVTMPSSGDGLPPSARIVAHPGTLPWIPDLEVRLMDGEDSLATAEFGLSERAESAPGVPADAAELPYRLELVIDMPQQSLSDIAHLLPAAFPPALFDSTRLAFSAAGAVAIPAVLALDQPHWYRDLPLAFRGAVQAEGGLPDRGVEAVALESAFTLAGSAGALEVSVSDETRVALSLDRVRAGLPAALQPEDGTLDFTLEVALKAPALLLDGELERVEFAASAALDSPLPVAQSLTLAATVAAARDQGELVLTGLSPLRLSGVTPVELPAALTRVFGWSTADKTVDLNLTENYELAWRQADGSWQLRQPLEIALSVDPGDSGKPLRADFTFPRFRHDPGKTSLAFAGTLTLPAQGGTVALPLDGSGNAEKGAWTLDLAAGIADWQLESASRIAIAQAGDIELAGQVRLPDLATAVPPVLALMDWQGELAITDGGAVLDYQVKLQDGEPPHSRVKFDVSGVTGLVAGTAVSGVQLTGAVAVDQRWRTFEPLVVTAETVSAGVHLTDVAASLELLPSAELTQSRWQLNQLSAAVFGGRIALEQAAQLDYPFSGNRLTFQVSNLQLGEVLRLYEDQGIRGQGVINGRVPLLFAEDGVSVEAGLLEGEASGGRLSFTGADAEALASTNQQLAMTLRVLEDFHFDQLKVAADLATDGALDLTMNLKGRNPAEYEGRQINLNVNLEENVFQLIKVLKLTDELTQRIEQRLESQSQ